MVELTIRLGFIELPAEKKPWKAESYEESGAFFVKSPNGEYRIVSVDKDREGVIETILPPDIANMLTEETVKDRMAGMLDHVFASLETLHKEVAECRGNDERLTRGYEKLYARGEEICDGVMEELGAIRHGVENRPEESSGPLKGFISEETLVQLVKEMKK